MREERKMKETDALNKIRGYEEYVYDKESKEKKIEVEEEYEDEKPSPFKRILIPIILIIILIIIYSIYIEPKLLLKVNEYGIKNIKLDAELNGLKIVQFSDIHYGTSINEKELDKAIKKINELKPDIVVFTGDLLDKNIKLSKNSKNIITKKLKEIKPKYYKYAIYGDNDYVNKEEYDNILSNSNFILLDNESTKIYLNNYPITISGINTNTKIDYSFLDTDTLSIVLDHKPSNIKKYLSHNPDIVFTSHSLGGVIRLPFIGGIFDNTKEYDKQNNTIIYNSYGIGTSNINIRFNNIPSINLYRIYKV